MTTSLKKTDLVLHLDWHDIETYNSHEHGFVIVSNYNKRWIRFGRLYPGLNRWYYSGHTGFAEYTEGPNSDVPTHWTPMPHGPWELDNV